MPDERPKLRPLELQPVNADGRQVVCLRDPLGFADGVWCVELQQYFIMSMFDGKHTILDIQAEFTKRFGTLLMSDDVKRIVEELDGHHLMETENFSKFRREVERKFRGQAVRHAVGPGSGYPESAEEIHEQLDAYLDAADPEQCSGTPKGLVAPHIDLTRGGPCYGHAYAALKRAEEIDTFVILGVAHAGAQTPFVATAKAFETPLGTVTANRDLVNRLAADSGLPLFDEEWVHRNEHSLEFQVVFLQHLFGDRFRIVPVLCSDFGPIMGPDKAPSECEPIVAFTDSLRRAIAGCDEPVCVIAGADLAHVGPQFGDPDRLNSAFMSQVEQADRQMLEHVVGLDQDAFYRDVMSDNNRRRICGGSAIYTLLAAGGFQEGRLIHYDQAVDDEGRTGVTFASAVFY